MTGNSPCALPPKLPTHSTVSTLSIAFSHAERLREALGLVNLSASPRLAFSQNGLRGATIEAAVHGACNCCKCAVALAICCPVGLAHPKHPLHIVSWVCVRG
jgi:hypothetical protein